MAQRPGLSRPRQRHGFSRQRPEREGEYHCLPEVPIGKVGSGGDKTSRTDQEKFAQLALPLFDSLYNLAHWLTANRADAEDLVQETYAKALKGFSSFQPGTDFRAWIFRILRNTFLTSRTGLAARLTSPLDEDQADSLFTSVTPETAVLLNADRDSVHRALERLELHHREIILLCDFEEMSYREIADMLSLPLGTVMSRLSRARQALRQAMLQAKGAQP